MMETVVVRDNREAAQAAQRFRQVGEGRVWLISSEPSAVYGDPRYLSLSDCRRLGVFTWKADHVAGCIVSAPGDLNVAEYSPEESDLGPRLLRTLAAHLNDTEIDGNDLLLKGKKVASWASMRCRGLTQTTAHVSLGLDPGLIEAICRKEQKKLPGILPGVHAETIIEWMGEEADSNEHF